MLRLAGLLLVSTCCAGFAAPIELMVEDAAAPWSNSDGSGYANDLVRAIYAAEQVPIKLTVVPYARCKAMVMSGLVAGCFSMSDAPELHGKVRFADVPLFQAYPNFFQHSAHPVRARSILELAPGTRVGIVNGYEYPEEILLMAKKGVRLESTRSEAVNLKKLEVGRLDLALVMLDDLKTDERIIEDAHVAGLSLAFQARPQGSFLGFSTKHLDGERARLHFNNGYKTIAANGVKQAIDRKWKALGTGKSAEREDSSGK